MGLIATMIIAIVSLVFAVAAIGPLLVEPGPRVDTRKPELRVIRGGNGGGNQEAA